MQTRLPLVLLCLVLAISARRRKCKKNETWNECTKCELTCDDDDNKTCEVVCGPPGCECEAAGGFKRNANGKCIPSSKCPKKPVQGGTQAPNCKKNEKWTSCSTCEMNCGDDEGKPCATACGPPKCECNVEAGFRRNRKGECVHKSRCSKKPNPGVTPQPKCGKNERWTECSSCELACGDDDGMPCAAVCGPPKCECNVGAGLRRNRKGECVRKSQCSNKPESGGVAGGAHQCKANERWTTCTGCELKCSDDDQKPCSIACGPPSCECRARLGFRRSLSGRCIPKVNCPKKSGRKCPKNEEWTDCGTCELACGDNDNATCSSICHPPQCECNAQKGYRRNKNGQCVPKSECLRPGAGTGGQGDGSGHGDLEKKCPPNESYKKCMGCQGACSYTYPICNRSCKAGCECSYADGFARDRLGKCIRRYQCSW